MPSIPAMARPMAEDQEDFSPLFVDQLSPAELIRSVPALPSRPGIGKTPEPGWRSGGARPSRLNGAPWRPVRCPAGASARPAAIWPRARPVSLCSRWAPMRRSDSAAQMGAVLAAAIACGDQPSRNRTRLRTGRGLPGRAMAQSWRLRPRTSWVMHQAKRWWS